MQHSNHSSNFAIVIPAYNEESTIHDIVTRSLKYSSLVIVIDDGSVDQTSARLEGLPVNLIKNRNNLGKAACLWAGIKAARQHNVKYIVTLDADGQHAPEDIPTLLAKAESQTSQIIIGARLADKSAIPAKRYYANKIANFWIAWAAGYPISDSQSGFRVYPEKLFHNLEMPISKRNSFVFESEILIKAAQQGIRCSAVSIPAVYAENARPSHFNGLRDITYITIMVARSLISRGFYLKGLYNSCIKPNLLPKQNSHKDYNGYLTLMLSVLIITLSFGVTFFLSFIYVLSVAVKSGCNAKASQIVVLGKKLRNNSPDYDYLQRLTRVKQIIMQSPDKIIYILGGITGESEISEASSGKRYLEHHDVKKEIIKIEESSRNTLENMKHLKTSTTVSEKPISLITNRYHLARAGIMAKGFGFDAERCAAEDSYTFGFVATLILLAEAFHLNWYMTGRTYAKLTRNKKILSRIQ